jgi:hypothetical protein
MSRLKSIKLPVSANLKLTLVAFALIIVAGTLWYTQHLVSELKRSQRRTINFYANALQAYSNASEPDPLLGNFTIDLLATIDFPMITADANREPQAVRDTTGKVSYTTNTKNIEFDSTVSLDAQKQQLKQQMAEMANVYDPLPVYYILERDSIAESHPIAGDSSQTESVPRTIAVSDSTVLMYIYFDDSDTVKKLRWLPYVEITIGAMFILVGYISFSHIKRNEQSNIWVGMAKETAHQLGTPLSSLLGWIELLRLMPDDRDQVLEAAEEMQRDVERLNKVAHRFSKIGSAAEVKPVEINAIITNVITYFQRRLPHLGKKVSLTLDSAEPLYVAINVDLFEWVFENLVRNAADAIDKADGEIRFRVHRVRNAAVIDIRDNGRGIDPKVRKDIFRPGFSTKKRGWGLGLSLAKRIVEDYHGGKITLKESSPKGTTFRILLDAAEPPADTAPEQAVRAENVEA